MRPVVERKIRPLLDKLLAYSPLAFNAIFLLLWNGRVMESDAALLRNSLAYRHHIEIRHTVAAGDQRDELYAQGDRLWQNHDTLRTTLTAAYAASSTVYPSKILSTEFLAAT